MNLQKNHNLSQQNGSLSPQHDASSHHQWRRQPTRYKTYLWIYSISNCRQPKTGDFSSLGVGWSINNSLL